MHHGKMHAKRLKGGAGAADHAIQTYGNMGGHTNDAVFGNKILASSGVAPQAGGKKSSKSKSKSKKNYKKTVKSRKLSKTAKRGKK